jgi:exopolyphosphatase/pppGpp-phosphohydrolase
LRMLLIMVEMEAMEAMEAMVETAVVMEAEIMEEIMEEMEVVMEEETSELALRLHIIVSGCGKTGNDGDDSRSFNSCMACFSNRRSFHSKIKTSCRIGSILNHFLPFIVPLRL